VVVGNAAEKLLEAQSENGNSLINLSEVSSKPFAENEIQERSLGFFPFLANAAYEAHGPSSIADFEPAYLKPYFFRQTYMEPMTGEQA
jgi:hypothetical protein